jgi:NADPH-dependent ferric siderophore reductase
MPEVPAFLANVFVPRFGRAAEVTDVVEVAPALRKVRFAGQALRGVDFRPGQEVEFRVGDRAFRHYTPAHFDSRHGLLDVIFFHHGEGPGARWAGTLQPGQRVHVLGPGGRFGLQAGARHVLLGDETALGLFVCFTQAAPGRCLGAVELSTDAQAWPERIGLQLQVAQRTAARGDALAKWLDSAPIRPSDNVCFYLVGHTGSIVQLRERLLQRGFPRRSVRTKPYWADGKRGL